MLCDDVVISHSQDKHNLVGIIGALGVRGTPAVSGGFVVYIRLSNVYSEQRVTVSFVSAQDDEVAWEFEAQLVSRNDPLAVHTLISRVPPFRLGKPGRYMLEAKHGGTVIAQTPIEVIVGPAHTPGIET